MKEKILGLMAVGLTTGPMAANASVIYEFTSLSTSLVYEAPGFILTNQDVSVANLTSCTIFGQSCTQAQSFLPDTSSLGVPPVDTVDAIGIHASGGSSFYYFDNGALGSFGTYADQFGSRVSLVVRAGSSSVPEPGTLALFGLGLVGLGLSRRRKAA